MTNALFSEFTQLGAYVYARICMYVCMYVRGAFNRFPDIFVQAFKIVVDSWKFTMLLLYIIWFQVQMNSYSSNWNTPH